MRTCLSSAMPFRRRALTCMLLSPFWCLFNAGFTYLAPPHSLMIDLCERFATRDGVSKFVIQWRWGCWSRGWIFALDEQRCSEYIIGIVDRLLSYFRPIHSIAVTMTVSYSYLLLSVLGKENSNVSQNIILKMYRPIIMLQSPNMLPRKLTRRRASEGIKYIK